MPKQNRKMQWKVWRLWMLNEGWSCTIRKLPERIWKGCNGKCIKTRAKCNGLCDKVFFPQCERPGGTCADLVDRSNVKRILMLVIFDGMCLELVSWNSTASCNGKCSPISNFDATLGMNECYYREKWGHLDPVGSIG